MRVLGQLTRGAKSTLITSSFYGYNHNPIISDGEMYDMENLSGDKFPTLAPRRRRGISSYDVEGQTPVPLTGIHGRDQLVFIRGTAIYYNYVPVTGVTVSADSSMLPKKIVSMGAYVCIWPDKVYFNTADLTDHGSMERRWNANSSGVSLILCRNNGTNYDMTNIDHSATQPADPDNGALWVDESKSPAVLKQYMAAAQEWMEIGTTYIKIQATGIGSGLKEYDVVNLSGLDLGGVNPDPVVAEQVAALNTSMIVYAAGENYIVVAGILSAAVEQGDLESGTVHADLTIPDLDYIIESNNRLWGCRYGMQDGQFVNEIYATALGDFRLWRRYMNNEADSWTGQVGTDGPFTGACRQRGYPVFIKENCFHLISGNTPSTFQINTIQCRGVQEGSWRSIQIVAENIYYKSRDGIMVFDGNMPQSISDQLGGELYSDARAGVLKDKYYISMKNTSNNYVLMVYDTKRGTWWKEDNTKALGFADVGDELFFIDEVTNTLVSVCGSVGTLEDGFYWTAEFDLYGIHFRGSNYDNPKRVRNQKYVSLFKIRAELAEGSFMSLYLKYNNGDWEFKGEKEAAQLKTFVLPVTPRRCDHIRVKLTGYGDATIYDLSRMLEVGGDG